MTPNTSIETSWTMKQLTCDLGTGFDLQRFCKVLYVQCRYMQSIGIEDPSFVFTLPSDQRDMVENAIIHMWKQMYGMDISLENRNEHATILGMDLPRADVWQLNFPRVVVVLMDQPQWDKLE